jgi:hypothetical protein
MPTPEQKKKLLRAKIAVAYYRETGKVPSTEIIDDIYYVRVSYKAILGLHYKRQEQKQSGQLPIF